MAVDLGTVGIWDTVGIWQRTGALNARVASDIEQLGYGKVWMRQPDAGANHVNVRERSETPMRGYCVLAEVLR
ncbi:hypothetical protein G1H11_07885 [Phytoactinopolyspora alkaliphila]|uniref:Uncharacterized protein n=1 Tax=Phytoactinopolyspora alkaliphila TaxID=1783498 RepID=A0A6N9YJU3_9ACTN|nr:hypothetical protein [Phytoactinopolyspora alkaliphila]NED95234.1 hypothetical protein [Phytoactinopolyspora alkaliphila]